MAPMLMEVVPQSVIGMVNGVRRCTFVGTAGAVPEKN